MHHTFRNIAIAAAGDKVPISLFTLRAVRVCMCSEFMWHFRAYFFSSLDDELLR